MSRRLPIAAFALVAACSPGHAATRGWQVTDFTRLRVEGPFDVHVHSGGPAAVRATGSQAAIDTLSVEQHGDTLVVRTLRTAGWANWSWGKGEPLVVDISTRALSGATSAGSGNVAIDRIRGDAGELTLAGSGNLSVAAVDAGTVRLSSNGSGNLTAAGHTRQADLLLLGAGDVRGGDLATDAASVRLVGSGTATIAARRTATVDLSGSGDVRVTGPAACTVHRSGSGSVRCAGSGSDGD